MQKLIGKDVGNKSYLINVIIRFGVVSPGCASTL